MVSLHTYIGSQAAAIPFFSILSNVILAHADDILPDLLLLLPNLSKQKKRKDDGKCWP